MNGWERMRLLGNGANLDFPGWDTGRSAEIEPIVWAEIQKQAWKRDKIIRLMVGGNQQSGTAAEDGVCHALERLSFGSFYIHFDVGNLCV